MGVMVKNQKKVEMAINQEVEKVNGKNGEMMMIGKVMMMTTTSKKVVKKEKNTTSREMVVMVKVKVENQKVMVKNQKKVEMAINQEVEKVNGKNGEMMMIGKVMMMMTTTSKKAVK